MPNKSMTVLAPETRVIITPDLVGVITGVLIEPNFTINYRVAYMSGGSRLQDYFYPCEIMAVQGDRDEVFIGFHTPDQQPTTPSPINSTHGDTNDFSPKETSADTQHRQDIGKVSADGSEAAGLS